MRQGVRIEFDVDDMIRRYRAGESCVDIARMYFCHEYTVRQRLRGAGVPKRPRNSCRGLRLDMVTMARQYASGMSCETIGRLHYVSATCVRRRLVRAGVTMRPPGYRPPSIQKAA
jgi:hypothetical protein